MNVVSPKSTLTSESEKNIYNLISIQSSGGFLNNPTVHREARRSYIKKISTGIETATLKLVPEDDINVIYANRKISYLGSNLLILWAIKEQLCYVRNPRGLAFAIRLILQKNLPGNFCVSFNHEYLNSHFSTPN